MKVKVKLENNKIIGYFYQYSEKPLHKTGCNFDERTDHATAVEVDVPNIENIHVGFSQVIYGTFVENAEQYELSLKQGV